MSAPSDAPGSRVSQAARLVAELPPLLLTLVVLALFGQTVAGRIDYPYDLEWMEGGMLLHALRVVQGLPIYVEPSADFIPYLYPPLYSWVVAALSMLPGVELTLGLGRLVSVVGTLAACGALVAAARHERVPWGLAIGAAGLYLSCYEDSGAFYDLVRTDGLLMGLTGWALVTARRGQVRTAGVLLTLAYATKHTFALFGAPILVWLLWTEGRALALRFVLWSVLPALAYTAVMQIASGGAFLTWMIEVPSVHGTVAKRLFPGAPKEIFQALPYSTGAALAVGLLWMRRWSTGGGYWFAQGLLALALCGLMRAHTGGFINVLMPGHWMVALWAALALGAVARRWQHPLVLGAAGALLALQIGQGRWRPHLFLPTDEDRAAGDALVERVRAIEGEVLSPYAPWIPVLAGKDPYWHLIALWDIDYKRGPYFKASKSVDQAITDRRWAAILVGDDDNLGHGLKRHYKKQERIRYKARAFYPKTGWKRRPAHIYVPLPPGEVGEAADEEKDRGAEEDERAPEPSEKADPMGGGI